METLDIRQVQTKLGLIAQVTADVDLEGFLAELEMADAVGPVLYPSEWIADVVAQCDEARVPVYVKQDAGRYPGRQGRIPDALWARRELPWG